MASRFPAISVAIAVFVLASAGLTILHRAPHPSLSRSAAVTAALGDMRTADALRGAKWDRVEVSDVDGQLERVLFFEGSRAVADVGVNGKGQVVQGFSYEQLPVPFGSPLAYQPMLMIGLVLLFVLAAGAWPLWRLRNLDVAMSLSLLAPVVLLQQRYLTASVLSAIPGLGYLMARCLWVAFGPDADRHQQAALFDRLSTGLDPQQRVRTLRILLGALALIFVMVGVSSTDAVDVIYGVMEGATKLIHGVLPYGHMPGDVVHGDTYPILSYVLYTPVALAAPVQNIWDSVDGGLAVAVLMALLAALGLHRAARGRFGGAGRSAVAEAAGLRAAIAWLSFPAVLIIVTTGTTDVALALMLVSAVLLWRRPSSASAMLAVAAWFKLAPLALIPLQLAPLRGRRLLGAVVVIGAVTVPWLVLLLVVGGLHGPASMIHAIAFQFARGSRQSFANALGLDALQPLGQACVVALIVGSAVHLRRFPQVARDRTRIAALSAAVLIGLQLTSAYWSFLYLAWVAPLVGLSLLAEPALAALPQRVPPATPASRLVPVMS